MLFNPARMRQLHFYDASMKTLLSQPMQQVDDSISKGVSVLFYLKKYLFIFAIVKFQMTRYLMRNGNPNGLDIASLNIQRGRDHAVRPYNDYREASSNSRITDFYEFNDDIARKLENVYDHPDDIDLWVGGLLEGAVLGGVVGPTFADIIADQFSRFRKGDRYFHEHHSLINPGAFTPQQLEEIRKVTLARIICENSDNLELKWIVPHAFLLPSQK